MEFWWGERGLYKTTDGGKTWNNTLEIDEWTGVTDLLIDPRNPDVLYCASWQRHRNVASYIGGGPGTSIYKSTDGGDSWTKINKGLPSSNMGKIGLAISPINPDVVYAAVETERRKGLYIDLLMLEAVGKKCLKPYPLVRVLITIKS